ncbi:MAG: hypothetical protein HZA32_13725 [Opitutae bacterium]|nr:hypothetical protein [Opitutae bacterium]
MSTCLEGDDLLKKMPAIAEAVNAFKSDSVQLQAFQVLIATFRATSGSERNIGRPEIQASATTVSDGSIGKSDEPGGKPRKRAAVGSPRVLGELDLKPDGKKSLKDFCGEKRPSTNEERFAVIIYYLQNTLGLSGITRDHVHTGFKDIGAKSPLDIDAGLRMTASRKGWIDTSKSGDIRMTVAGENLVEHDLPPKTKV